MRRVDGVNRAKTMSFLDRFLIISVVLLASVFPVELFPNTGPVPRGGDGQFSGKQGQVVVVTVPVVVVAAVVLASSVVLPEPLSLQARGANRVAQIRSDKQ